MLKEGELLVLAGSRRPLLAAQRLKVLTAIKQKAVLLLCPTQPCRHPLCLWDAPASLHPTGAALRSLYRAQAKVRSSGS